MKHRIAHDLEIPLAKQAATHAFEAYKARYPHSNPTLTWSSDRDARIGFEVKGVKIAGTFSVLPNAIEIDLEVPFIFQVFKKKAMDVIEREVKLWVEKAKAGQLPATAVS